MLVADTSALVSLAITDSGTPIRLLFQEYDIRLPPAVVAELEDIATYDDTHADAAARVLAQLGDEHVEAPDERPDYPLDDGETAAITLANETNAAVFLCDEYRELSTIHAVLSESRLVTTPKLIEAFTRRDVPGELLWSAESPGSKQPLITQNAVLTTAGESIFQVLWEDQSATEIATPGKSISSPLSLGSNQIFLTARSSEDSGTLTCTIAQQT
ncbi:hypothetical protein BRC71_05175 [Halobacteriales archaeon QH_7_65_31]|nr:MAG: hypothetical protein BRC71_05175 [Halobacteriales archaeon QH_7_65_31]